MANFFKAVGVVVLLALVLWTGAARTAWYWRNPLGNKTTFIRHLPTAMMFGRVSSLQEQSR